jgi:uncharacterized surface protein with fasciclin (FAS1) repeats
MKSIMKSFLNKFASATLALIIGLTAVAAPAYADDHDDDEDLPNIVEIAETSGQTNTLFAAVGAAGLGGALSADGPLTVFAPIDTAFSALGVDTINDLLKPENIDKLTSILTYHVAEGKTLSTDLSDGMMVPTLNGQQLEVSIDGDTVMINNATVIAANVMASNGVIHLIDTVLMPEMEDKVEEEKPNIVGIATSDDNFSSLVTALTTGPGAEADLVGVLSGDGPFTVFAPTNEAFANLPLFAQRALERNPELITDILTYHVVSGTIESKDIKRYQRVATVEGSKITARALSSGVKIDKANVIAADIHASNGVVHVIDRVLIPRSLILDELKRVQKELREILSALRAR